MLFWIILTFIIILEAKVLRDIIAFRFSWSILTKLPAWLQRWLRGHSFLRIRFGVPIKFDFISTNLVQGTDLNTDINVFDGWHVSDGFIIAPAWILAMWFYLESFLWALISYAPFWIVFYQAFNWQYHWLWMLPEYRENPWKRK
jgi:hypothetical protein